MQLQKSLFSFYKVFILKIPVYIFYTLCLFTVGIILIQTNWAINRQYLNNYEQCFIQYYNVTRQVEDSNKDNQKNKTKSVDDLLNRNTTVLNELPINLKLDTTRIKFYFNDIKDNKQNYPICKIILNTQKIDDTGFQDDNVQTDTDKQRNLVQQQSDKAKDIQNKEQQLKSSNNNIKNYNQITRQQYNLLTNEHPDMHLTANNHVMYLDNDNKFQQKHGIKNHAIILNVPLFQLYPQTIFGISSKLWRFHYNEQLNQNQFMMKTLADSFVKVNKKIEGFYIKQREDYNKKHAENNQTKNNTKQVIIINQQVNVKQSQSQTQKISYAPLFPVYPLYNLFIYFHYPGAILKSQQLSKMLILQQNQSGFILKIFSILIITCILMIISTLVGLLVRYLFFLILTVYLFLGGCFINKQWGWVYKWYKLIKSRQNNQGADNVILSSIKMFLYFMLAFLGVLFIFTFGSRYILQGFNIFDMSYYSQMFFKNIFIIQLFFYISCRSRLSIKYFPRFSIIISIITILSIWKYFYFNIVFIINLHLLIHFLLIFSFSCIQNKIGTSQFKDNHTPCQQKPRAMYYAGYDISWQDMIPPIWTYFTFSFDIKCFGDKEKCLIDKDYQLLYGRLLGMNQRQELPEDQQQEQQERHQLNQNFSESHQMSLIR